MKIQPEGGSLSDSGQMYSHGMAAMALCEACAMNLTREQLRRRAALAYGGDGRAIPRAKQRYGPVADNVVRLGPAAQAAIDFIRYAQDPAGGGWRYQPRMPGDTSILGWQLMALVSGRMAHLAVDANCFALAARYLDFVQKDSGADYGYTGPVRGSGATRAIGLLCRMYMGWQHDHPPLHMGIQALRDIGFSSTNIYYNYYATQVMHHYGGEGWKMWNQGMRDFLVRSQSKVQHEAGSWYFSDSREGGGAKGGRLYCTALATMTLEVYYRHMPLYQEAAFAEPGAKVSPPAAKSKKDGLPQ
jgi:hypothetical protein